jgi:hypothetical protein
VALALADTDYFDFPDNDSEALLLGPDATFFGLSFIFLPIGAYSDGIDKG